MTKNLPFGADTIVIPFTWKDRPPQTPRRVVGMSRMRPPGELFRNGVVNTADERSSSKRPEKERPDGD